MIKYSVIVPHYNDFKSLERLLDSIPARDNIEVVVVDDKSTHSYNLELIKSKCTFLSNKTDKKNAGVCRNIGLNVIKGQWVIFADSDDVFLESAFDIFDKYADCDDDIIFFKSTSVEDATGEISDRHSYLVDLVERNLCLNDPSLRYMYFPPWGKLIRRSLIQKNGIAFDEVAVSNDVMFSLKTGYCAKTVSSVDEVVYCVHRRDNSLTSTPSKANRRIRLKIALDRNEFLVSHGLKSYQFSFSSILLNFGDVFSLPLLLRFMKSCILLKQRILPHSFSIDVLKRALRSSK